MLEKLKNLLNIKVNTNNTNSGDGNIIGNHNEINNIKFDISPETQVLDIPKLILDKEGNEIWEDDVDWSTKISFIGDRGFNHFKTYDGNTIQIHTRFESLVGKDDCLIVYPENDFNNYEECYWIIV